MHVYEVRPRKDHRGFDLISDALPFGRLWYAEPHAISRWAENGERVQSSIKFSTFDSAPKEHRLSGSMFFRPNTAFLGLCLMIAACEQKPQSTASSEQSSTPSSQPNAAASFNFQERCAKQAREQFDRSYWAKQEMTGFTNHYNEKLNRCFMLVENTDVKSDPGTMWINKTLLDAFEGKELATYSWHSDKVKKYWEVPPFQCEVTLPSGEKKICNSDVEFEELIKVYME